MNFDWSQEDQAFRARVRDFLARELPPQWPELSRHGPGSPEETRFSRMFCPRLAAQGLATTMTQCVKPADVQDGKRTVPQQDPKCEMKDYKMQGNTASWRFECKGPEAMNGSGSMTYSGNSYSGTTKMNMKQQGRVVNMTQSYSGKRLGDCK